MATKRPRENDPHNLEQCASCGRFFTTETELTTHISRTHSSVPNVSFTKCNTCHRAVYGITLEEHKIVAKDSCINSSSSSNGNGTSLSSSSSSSNTTEEEIPSAPRFEDLFTFDENKDYLGSGVNAKVYTCHSTALAPRVFKAKGRPLITNNLCVKVYRGDLFRQHEEEVTKTIDREYKALQEVENPYIIRVIALFKNVDELGNLASVHLVLEKAVPPSDGPKLQHQPESVKQKYGGPGELFRYLVGRGRTSEGVARFIMFQLLAAVQCLHAIKPLPIVHRDLKPENVLVFGEVSSSAGLIPRLKLTDFGTARHVPIADILIQKAFLTAELGSPQYIAPELLIPVPLLSSGVGSPHYIAPEVLFPVHSNSSSSSSNLSSSPPTYSYTENVDIYSLGVTLFFIIAFDYPYASVNDQSSDAWRKNTLTNKIRWELVDPLLSSSGKDLLRWMLQKNGKLRFSAEQCLAHRWFDPIREEVAILFKDGLLKRFARTRM